MKLSDYVADWVAGISPTVYGVTGAGAMHLHDSLYFHRQIKMVAMHHEQAAVYAAEAHARVTNRPAVVSVTVGPSALNCVTGVAAAWVDSIPMIVLAGQASTVSLASRNAPRHRARGVNEAPARDVMLPITKYAVTVDTPASIGRVLRAAEGMATTGRPGPVFVEIPLDIQAAQVNPGQQDKDVGSQWRFVPHDPARTEQAMDMLAKAKRPVLIVGNGIRLAGAQDALRKFLERAYIPVCTSWCGSDLLPTGHPMVIGRPGLFGDRAGNFAVQNADLILAIGTRLSIPQIGHTPAMFAPVAKKIVVDVDTTELDSKQFGVDLPVLSDAKAFLDAANGLLSADDALTWPAWLGRCRRWRFDYPVMQHEYREQPDGVNSYYVCEALTPHLTDDAIVVTDVGAGFISPMQMLPLRAQQRLFHSCGLSPMGWGLPAAIGACLASGGKRQIICMTGDGGLMLNMQELQTIVHHQLPIAILVFANNGYMTIRATQRHHFGREAMAGPDSGLSVPDFEEIAKAFGIPAWSLYSNKDVADWMGFLSERKHPMIAQLYMRPDQPLGPRVQSRMEQGRFIPSRLEDMYPYLPREELAAQMTNDMAMA